MSQANSNPSAILDQPGPLDAFEGKALDIGLYEASVIRRILCGQSTNGETAAMAEPWKGLAERLAALPLEGRGGVYAECVGKLANVDEVARLIFDQDPSVHPSLAIEAGGRSGEAWPLLRLKEAPKAAPFPVDVFPSNLRDFCREVAESTLAPVDFVGLSMLTTAGASIGQSVNVQVKRGWWEAPLLYSVIVAEPGRAKTPAVNAATRPLLRIDERLRLESKEAREKWEEATKKGKRKGDGDEGAGDGGEGPGPEPPQRRAVCKDITRESLAIVLADNPRGVLCSPDEATAWVGSFDQYKGKGTDRQFWLSNYSGGSLSVDRKGGRESIHVSHPFCAVIGGIQPDLLSSMRDDRGRDDGFLDRIVFAFPDDFPRREWTEREISQEAERDWSNAIGRLHSVPMRVDDKSLRPHTAVFTPGARARFVAWFNQWGQLMDEPESQAGAMSKAQGRCARLALILSRLRLACDPTQRLWSDEGAPPIALEDVEGAIRLTEYFANHLERVAPRMIGDDGGSAARSIVKWIERNHANEFREADISGDLRRFRQDRESLATALKSLELDGAIRSKPESAIPGKRGPKPSQLYEVHPALK